MADKVLRLASYNIRKARGLDQKRVPERTLYVINQLGADIVVLQEADKRLGARKPALPHKLVEAETDFQIVSTAKNGISLGWHGNAVLIRKGLNAKCVRQLDLPGLEPRGAVCVDLDVGKGLCVVATHLGLLRRDRRAQLKMLCRETANREHTVIAGDFNEWARHKGLEALKDRFETHSPGQSFHARRPVAALDRIAISRGLQMRAAGVEQGSVARRASDHLPVWTDIVLPANAATC
ncbi:MAG: endonuclease/exonuclease/phosphatase family protein [Pseudomonadota bacterium]